MSEKRKCVVLDLSQKLDIIKRLQRGESAVSIAPIYDVGRTTVNDIEKNADKIESHISKLQNFEGNMTIRKITKNASLEQLDSVVYQWFLQTRSQGVPLSGPII